MKNNRVKKTKIHKYILNISLYIYFLLAVNANAYEKQNIKKHEVIENKSNKVAVCTNDLSKCAYLTFDGTQLSIKGENQADSKLNISSIIASNDITTTGNLNASSISVSKDANITGNLNTSSVNASKDVNISGNLSTSSITSPTGGLRIHSDTVVDNWKSLSLTGDLHVSQGIANFNTATFNTATFITAIFNSYTEFKGCVKIDSGSVFDNQGRTDLTCW